MPHRSEAHEWGSMYEHKGTTYRECTDLACDGHQEWICILDRWSDAFDTPAPRRRTEALVSDRAQPLRERA